MQVTKTMNYFYLAKKYFKHLVNY